MEEQATRVILSFFLSMCIVFVTALLIGDENKAIWFKKRDLRKSFFNRRGLLGEKCHFGHPRTWQGLMVAIVMFGLSFSVSYVLVFQYDWLKTLF